MWKTCQYDVIFANGQTNWLFVMGLMWWSNKWSSSFKNLWNLRHTRLKYSLITSNIAPIWQFLSHGYRLVNKGSGFPVIFITICVKFCNYILYIDHFFIIRIWGKIFKSKKCAFIVLQCLFSLWSPFNYYSLTEHIQRKLQWPPIL